MRKMLAGLACLGMLSGVTGIAHALITNGGFEGGSVGNSFVTLNAGGEAGNTSIEGWTIYGSVDWINQYWNPSEGSHSLDLAGYYQHGFVVSDPFATEIGARYRVSFDMAGNPDQPYTKSLWAIHLNDPDPEHMGGVHQFDFVQDGHTGTAMAWESHYFNFIATGEFSQIAFTDVTNIDIAGWSEAWGAAIDNVSVEPVPEPSTLFLLGAGLAGLGMFRRRRSK